MFNETPEQERLLNKLVMDGYKWPVDVWEVKRVKAIVTYKQFEARDGWIVWRGGEQPVGDGVVVDIHYKRREGYMTSTVAAKDVSWGDTGLHLPSIVAWRPHKAAQPKPSGHPHAELMAQYCDII